MRACGIQKRSTRRVNNARAASADASTAQESGSWVAPPPSCSAAISKCSRNSMAGAEQRRGCWRHRLAGSRACVAPAAPQLAQSTASQPPASSFTGKVAGGQRPCAENRPGERAPHPSGLVRARSSTSLTRVRGATVPHSACREDRGTQAQAACGGLAAPFRQAVDNSGPPLVSLRPASRGRSADGGSGVWRSSSVRAGGEGAAFAAVWRR